MQFVCKSPTPIHLYKVKSLAGIVGYKCTDAIAKHQAFHGGDSPAKTTFSRIILESNHFYDTTWLAFEEASRTHASTSECTNSPASELKHFPNLHGALRMHSKERLGMADTESGYYSH
eukprot:1143278-Pelagomonas_calceolata.AAC.1